MTIFNKYNTSLNLNNNAYLLNKYKKINSKINYIFNYRTKILRNFIFFWSVISIFNVFSIFIMNTNFEFNLLFKHNIINFLGEGFDNFFIN